MIATHCLHVCMYVEEIYINVERERGSNQSDREKEEYNENIFNNNHCIVCNNNTYYS